MTLQVSLRVKRHTWNPPCRATRRRRCCVNVEIFNATGASPFVKNYASQMIVKTPSLWRFRHLQIFAAQTLRAANAILPGIPIMPGGERGLIAVSNDDNITATGAWRAYPGGCVAGHFLRS